MILGLGGGSVIETLRKDFDYKNHITTVEIDPIIIGIAKDEYNQSEHENLQIVCDDALEFIKQNKLEFDLIIIDLFVDTEVPESFLQTTFFDDIIRSNSDKGSILFNASINSNNDENLSEFIINNYKTKQLNKVKH